MLAEVVRQPPVSPSPHCRLEPKQRRLLRGQAHLPWVQPTASAFQPRTNSQPRSFLHAFSFLHGTPMPPPCSAFACFPQKHQEIQLGTQDLTASHGRPLSACLHLAASKVAWGRVLFALISVLFVRMEPTPNNKKISQRIQI